VTYDGLFGPLAHVAETQKLVEKFLFAVQISGTVITDDGVLVLVLVLVKDELGCLL
jgi:hypothetical protein